MSVGRRCGHGRCLLLCGLFLQIGGSGWQDEGARQGWLWQGFEEGNGLF